MTASSDFEADELESQLAGDDQETAGADDLADDLAVATGDPVIDDALARLDQLGELPVQQHPEAFEHVHRVLRDSLSGNRAP